MLKQVTSTPGLALRRRVTTPARVVVSALIFLITWGATVEVVHRHDGLRLNLGANTTSVSAGSVNQSPHVSQTGDCLICQLHLNLFNGLLHTPPSAPPIAVLFSFTTALVLLHLSLSVTQRRGRAPPLVSLL